MAGSSAPLHGGEGGHLPQMPHPGSAIVYLYIPPGKPHDTVMCHDYGLIAQCGWANDARASMTNHPDDSG